MKRKCQICLFLPNDVNAEFGKGWQYIYNNYLVGYLVCIIILDDKGYKNFDIIYVINFKLILFFNAKILIKNCESFKSNN